MKFFNRKVIWKKPVSADFVIIDYHNSSRCRSVLPEGYSVSVIGTRPTSWFLHPKVLVLTFKYLTDVRLSLSRSYSHSFLIGTLKQIECVHIKAVLTCIKPKGVITGIDNSERFAWLSNTCNEIPFFAIQNGFRLSFDALPHSLYSTQHLFCFGEREVRNFPKLGYKVNNFYPVGSLLASRHFQSIPPDESLEYDLLIVSCWRGNIGFTQDVQDSMKSMELMDRALFHYLRTRNLKAAVISRSERDTVDWVMHDMGCSEEEYYKSIYGDSIKFIDSNFAERNVYTEMLKSRVILAAFATTCLFEAFGWGKKVLYANFCEKEKYFADVSEEILFNYTGNNQEHFFSVLDDLIAFDSDDYIEEYRHLMRDYMNFPSNSTTTNVIKDKIKEIIATDSLNHPDHAGK